MKYFIMGCVLFIFCLSGCTNSELERTKSELAEAGRSLEQLQVQNKENKEDIRKLTRELSDANMKNHLLSNQIEALNEWAKKLTDGYGTGIWITEDAVYPIFAKSMKSADVNDIINELNQIYEKNRLPKVLFQKIKDRKAYVEIENSDQLTQRMGTSGASSYLNEVTFSICSVKDIDCVNIAFMAGDHALPGDYCH